MMHSRTVDENLHRGRVCSAQRGGISMTTAHWKGVVVAAVVVLALAGGPAVAEQATLERDEVGRYVESMRALQELSREQEDMDEELSPEQAMALQQEHTAILERHGFDQGEWMATHQRVMQAAMAINMQREMGEQDADAQIDAQREEILANENIPEEQREVILEQLEEQRRMVAEIQDNPDVDAVEPYYDELHEIFDGGS